MAAQTQVSAQERQLNFAMATRQTYQTLPTKRANGEGDTLQFNLPKARLLSKIMIEVQATAILKSANASIPKHAFSPYGILRRVSLDLNNGFMPFIVSGKEMYLYSLNRLNPDVLNAQSSDRGMAYVENGSTAAGKEAKIKFMVALPLTLNDRDANGLILLQNEETSVTLTIDIGYLKDAYATATGDTVSFKDLSVTPLVETFTVPASELARPDLSVLKLVQSKSETFAGGGQNNISLQTGTIYRKMVMYFEDQNGNPLTDNDFQGNMELVFNTADIPVQIKPSMLSSKNHSDLGFPLPAGVYVFDWSNQGIPNLGGTRDYIDTENLTVFELKFNTQKAGKVTIVPETLSRLV